MRIWWGWIVLTCLAASPAEAVDTRDVLTAHAEAHGLPQGDGDGRALHLVADVSAFGLTGTFEMWAEPPLRVWSDLDLGPLTLESGFDGDTGWIRDRNGHVRPAEGQELTGLLLDAVLQTGAYVLDSPPLPLQCKARQKNGRLWLDVNVEPAATLTLELDADTHRLVSSEWHTGQAIERSRVQDFVEVEGRLVPRHVLTELGTNMRIEFALTLAERDEPRGAEFYAQPASDESRDVRFVGGVTFTELPIVGMSEHILIPGHVGSVRGMFLLDTGAGGNVFHRGKVEKLGLSVEGDVEATGVGGNAKAGFVDIERVRLGDLELVHQNWMTLDFSNLEPVLGGDVLGVLGFDVLSRVVTQIDYIQRVVRFLDLDTFEPPTDAVAVPLRMDSNVPTVQVSIDGRPGWVHVDTGSNNTLDLTVPFVDAHNLLDEQTDLQESGLMGLGGVGQSLRGSLPKFVLAEFEFEALPTYFHREATGVFANTSIAGILGAGVLRNFDCTFDYSRSTLWLKPNLRYSPSSFVPADDAFEH